MHDFKFKNNKLYCENIKVETVAKKVGTPFYLYSHKTLVDHYTKIRSAFKEINPLICFAVKSNGNSAVLKALSNQGSGFDIVSIGELKKLQRIKADTKKICFTSVGKTEEEIKLAIKAGILLFNVESASELTELNRIAKKMNKKVKAALRINPNVAAATLDKITTGTLKKKFGIDLATSKKILKEARKYPNVDLCGLHMHIGSQIVTKTPFINALKKVCTFIEDLKLSGIKMEFLDIGGGLGIIYKNEKPQTAKKFAKAVMPYLKRTGLKIILEPGRFISGNAGIFVTKVLYHKNNGVKNFYIVDGGMNDLVRPAFYDSYHEIVPLTKKGTKKIKVDVVGPICESSDYFGKDRLLPQMKKGNLLAVMSAGAYCYVMASNYNARTRPPEIMVKGNKFDIVNKRETFDNLIKSEKIPKFLK